MRFHLPSGPGGLRRPWSFYSALLALLAVTFLATAPIVAIDQDLWYHLSHGRHIVDTGTIPSTSYFSFVDPPRTWVDYYWLFQVTVWSLFDLAGYPALLLLRALLYGGLLAACWGLLFHRPGDGRPNPGFGSALIFGLLVVHHLFKFQLVRPHMVSYGMIAVFLLILETRPRWIWALPPLAVVWVNVHGVEYPVMVMIALAYTGELLLGRWRRGGDPAPGEVRRLACLGLVVLSVLATPHGSRLLAVPFTSTELASHYLAELSRPPWTDHLAVAASWRGMPMIEAFNVLMALAVLAALAAAVARRSRPAHLLMAAGGLVLLVKAVRFTHEASLLWLPLLAAAPWPTLRWPVAPWTRALRLSAGLGAGLLLSIPLLDTAARFRNAPDVYPLSQRQLPVGIAAFLQQVDGGGRVFNNPNVGGYLQFALPDRYRIFMDLEIPFLFHDEDMYEAASAFLDPAALGNIIERYRPEFIAATLAADGFPSRIAQHADYRLVFFDDTAALYADRRAHPWVDRRELRVVDPFRLAGQRLAACDAAGRLELLDDLEKILDVAPTVQSAAHGAAILHNLDGRFQSALDVLAPALDAEPSRARTWALRADALGGLGRWDDAARGYRTALDRSGSRGERRSILRSLSMAYEHLNRHEAAFEAFERSVGKFHVEAPYGDLYRLATLAARIGELDRAHQLLSFALWKTPEDATEWRRRIEDALSKLDA
ncbi:MAG: tetratricopeptide repeat protein [Acidobacteriota bacterium]